MNGVNGNNSDDGHQNEDAPDLAVPFTAHHRAFTGNDISNSMSPLPGESSSLLGNPPLSDSNRFPHQTRTVAAATMHSEKQKRKIMNPRNVREARGTIKSLLQQKSYLFSCLQSSNVHCIMAEMENEHLREVHRAASKKGSEHRFKTSAQVLTSAEGLAEWDAEKAARAEKQKKADDAVIMAQDRLSQRAAAAASSESLYSGALTSKNKDNLQEIAMAFGLTTDGTKAEIIQRIDVYMGTNGHLRENRRFAGLFTSRDRRALKSVQGSQDGHEPDPEMQPEVDSAATASMTMSGHAATCSATNQLEIDEIARSH